MTKAKIEREYILKELQDFYVKNEDRNGFIRIELYTKDDTIQSVSVQMKEDPTIENLAGYFPVVQMSNGDELIILCPSVPIRKNRTIEQSRQAADFVANRVKELIRIRNVLRFEEKGYMVKSITENQSNSFDPYKALAKLAVEDPARFAKVVDELEKTLKKDQ
ncbi:hypothetical protein [uncultured Enterococcus sp.]|uniref:hypothetical protein n=1 Tax=uncultured Enterococcus sp. TaxID=167972 RepID=UPI002AA71258|nr:hypothetical protein [uncultured Enterococcus sp.]